MICWTNVDEALKCNMSDDEDDEDDGMKYGGINYSLGKSCLFILYFLVLWRDVSNRRQITSNQKCNEMAWDEHYFTTEQHLQSWNKFLEWNWWLVHALRRNSSRDMLSMRAMAWSWYSDVMDNMNPTNMRHVVKNPRATHITVHWDFWDILLWQTGRDLPRSLRDWRGSIGWNKI